MNKRSRKTKGLSHRLIALLLCCVCLLAAMPAGAAFATDAAPSVVESVAEQPTEVSSVPEAQESAAPAAPEVSAEPSVEPTAEPSAEPTSKIETGEKLAPQSFYNDVMAAQSCQAVYELISDDANYEKATALTVEQVYAIRDYAQSLEDDGYQEILVQTVNELLKYLGEDIDSEYDIDTESDINPGYYRKSIPVYWDTTNGKTTSASSSNGAHVESVTLNREAVSFGNSSNTSSWSGGKKLETYFSGAYSDENGDSNYQMQDATLSITAEAGYYVTSVIVACAPATDVTPYNCSTWKAGNEFIQEFDLTNSVYTDGLYKLEFNINSKNFSHDGRSPQTAYFILIQVATVPTPLYVEYNYGNVQDFLTVDAKSAFFKPTWTVVASENTYGNGSKYDNGVLTADTQFAYQYPNSEIGVIASWSHKANSVSQDALAEAAAAGYYFAGWSVTWYNDCSVSKKTNSYNDNYTMSFSNTYMTGSYKPDDTVQLPTNVRLVAQWKPIELKVTKTVSGLNDITEFASKSNTYTLQLQNVKTSEYVTLQSKDYTITGDGSLSYTFAAAGADVEQVITPGTYRVVETGTYDIKGSSENAYCTTTYPMGTVEVEADGTVQELKVLNTYSSTPATVDITIKKVVSGNMGDQNKAFTFTVDGNSVSAADKTFALKHNETKTITVKVGDTIKISETPDGYDASYQVGDEKSKSGYSVTYTAANEKQTIVFTNRKEVTIDTGVVLDKLPYILILVIVAAGIVAVSRRRKSRAED